MVSTCFVSNILVFEVLKSSLRLFRPTLRAATYLVSWEYYAGFRNVQQFSLCADKIDQNPCCDQGVAYRIGNLSNADISDFFVYRRVYRIEPPISSISIFSKPMIFLSFFAENSKNSPKIPRKFRKPMNQSRQQQQQRRKFQKFAENSENSPKIPQKEGLLWGPHIVSYRIVSRKKPSYRIDIVSNRKKAYRYWLVQRDQTCRNQSKSHDLKKTEMGR